MIPYYHNEGCGEIAFLFEHMPPLGSSIQSNIARNFDGSPIVRESKIKCGVCGKRMWLRRDNFTKKVSQ